MRFRAEIGKMETVRQRCRDWCWAACIQAVFSLQGRETAQEWAVEKIFGSSKCRVDGDGANAPQIIRAINGEWIDQYGFKFQAAAEVLPDAALVVSTSVPGQGGSQATDMATQLFFNGGARQLVSELDRGRPLIIGAVGHARSLLLRATSRIAPAISSSPSSPCATPGPTIRIVGPSQPTRCEGHSSLPGYGCGDCAG